MECLSVMNYSLHLIDFLFIYRVEVLSSFVVLSSAYQGNKAHLGFFFFLFSLFVFLNQCFFESESSEYG